MALRLKVLVLGLFVFTWMWMSSALTPTIASAKWGVCAIQALGNYEFSLYPFCYSVETGTGIAERTWPNAAEQASEKATGTVNLKVASLGLTIKCQVADTSKFYNEESNGKGSVAEYVFSECAPEKLTQCTTSVKAENLPYKTKQSISEEKFFVLIQGISFKVTITGASCALAGTYQVKGELEGFWFNTSTEQLVFPSSPLKGSSLTMGVWSLVISGAESFEGIKGKTVEAVLK